MFRNYLKITYRNLLKHKGFSFINIFGLAAGIACSLLISLYVLHELSFEKWNPNAERIVRIYSDINFGGNHNKYAVSGSPIGPDVAREIPEVQTFCRFRDYGMYFVKREGEGQQNFKEPHVLTVDSTFFEVFPLDLLEGDLRNSLTQPNSVAISASRADKYFGSPQLAIGRNLVLDNRSNWKVTAVYEDLPANTHFAADLLLSMNGNREVKDSPPMWAMSNNFHTYILLRKGSDPAGFAEKFAKLSREKVNQAGVQLMGMTIEEFEATGQHARFGLQPVTDIHLHSDLDVELAPNGNIQYVWIFGAIAFFILLIACINFMNLATAQSAHRAKEVGVRKALGSLRGALVGQFLTESLAMSAMAVAAALILASLALPWFGELTGRQITMPWGNPVFWFTLLGGAGLVGLLAGSYPAFFLSAFDAVKVLKGSFTGNGKGGGLRSGLVVFQFATSTILIIGTLLVYKQLDYIQNKNLGFEKDQVIILDDTWTLRNQVGAFKQEVLKNPLIKEASISSYLPVPNSSRSSTTFTTSPQLKQDNALNMGYFRVDEDYLAALGLEMVRGRFFDNAQTTDSSGVILNETAAAMFGHDDPIGKKLYLTPEVGPDGEITPDMFEELTVIGVVKDFHWESLRNNISSLCLLFGQSRGSISVRHQAGETEAVVDVLQSTWKDMAPGQPFAYRFLDEEFASAYEAEQKVATIAAGFALLSVLISCLGLFGLASFMAERRTKEIGIRKILGAQTGNLIALLSKDFLKLVGLAIVIAIPLGWFAMHQWLEDFAYRIDIGWGVFLVAGLAAAGIALFSVSYQAVRTAMSDPVKSLRSD